MPRGVYNRGSAAAAAPAREKGVTVESVQQAQRVLLSRKYVEQFEAVLQPATS